jgi:hypothetical protein
MPLTLPVTAFPGRMGHLSRASRFSSDRHKSFRVALKCNSEHRTSAVDFHMMMHVR